MSRKGKQSSTAVRRLMTEYRQLTKDPPEGISAGPQTEDDFLVWDCLLAGPKDTCYEGGVFSATLEFPSDYPLNPPKMKFSSPIFHPNVYKDGTVCISILHPPGDDPNMYESAAERWSPIQSVEKILISVISMLAEPNAESGANIDASKMWRDNPEEFKRLVRQQILQSLDLRD